jgi:hypothetical protein
MPTANIGGDEVQYGIDADDNVWFKGPAGSRTLSDSHEVVSGITDQEERDLAALRMVENVYKAILNPPIDRSDVLSFDLLNDQAALRCVDGALDDIAIGGNREG